jgi:Ca-activated chloride channel family protein
MIDLGAPIYLHTLWAVPAAALLLWVRGARQRSALRRFADANLLPALAPTYRRLRRAMKFSAILVSLSLIALALSRPQGNPREIDGTATGRDVVFLIDVSRSMLASDLAPTRLERAKLWIKDVTATLRGDRVALVAFAGSSIVKCPLTTDYTFFSLALDDLNPTSVARGGTNIGDAIRNTLTNVYDTDPTRHRDLILITDGEDQESFPITAAEQARERNVRIIALGLGDAGTGAPVTLTDDKGRHEQLEYAGKPVLSRQDTGTLAKIAAASANGVYLNLGTGTIELDRVYRDLIGSAEKSETTAKSVVIHDEYFQWFLGAALAFLVLDCLVSESRRRSVP